jgi:hypothetical protein
VVNGAATIMMFVFIGPQVSVMTDDVIEGRTTESHFRRAVVWLVGSRLAGALLFHVWLSLGFLIPGLAAAGDSARLLANLLVVDRQF